MRFKIRHYSIEELKTRKFFSTISCKFVSGLTAYKAYKKSNEAGTMDFYQYIESDNSPYFFI